MNNFYLITFTPLGRFFFGSSESWGESFYAKSLRFPTQTTILGCLRRTLLKQNEMLNSELRYPQKGSNYEKLTGSSKAKGLDEADTDLGILKKLSPVFVVKTKEDKKDIEEILFPLPMDVCKKDDSKIGIVEYAKNIEAVTSRNFDSSYKRVTGGKTYPAEILGNKKAWDAYSNSEDIEYTPEYEIDKIIIPTDQPGIAREDRNKKEGEFYRKKDFMLADNYSFGVVAETENSISGKLKDELVFLGGEQSKFFMKIIELNDNMKSKFLSGFNKFFNSYEPTVDSLSSEASKVVLLSHLLTDNSPTGIAHSIIGKMETIRSLNESGHKTYSFRAIPAGSIFYTNGNISFLNSYKFATKIGYNFFIEINN